MGYLESHDQCAVLCNLFHEAFFFYLLQYCWMLDLNTEAGIVIQELDFPADPSCDRRRFINTSAETYDLKLT